MVLIEDEDQTLEELGVCDDDQIIIEIRNKDLTWPEEIGSLSINSGDKCKQCKYLRSVHIDVSVLVNIIYCK